MIQVLCGKTWASRMPSQTEIHEGLILNAKKLMQYVNQFVSLPQTCTRAGILFLNICDKRLRILSIHTHFKILIRKHCVVV